MTKISAFASNLGERYDPEGSLGEKIMVNEGLPKDGACWQKGPILSVFAWAAL
ncbi:hypothetical protein CHELA1G11_20216 [Hyphomicrobiales bacterium]|nr:hypothetical protein CHELA1G11_20216 [Hyphomicrobiales bacterium]CAH1689150.1 hypothetical protein CHELA1G2_20532 [Hyphomicrobiales bacterium]